MAEIAAAGDGTGCVSVLRVAALGAPFDASPVQALRACRIVALAEWLGARGLDRVRVLDGETVATLLAELGVRLNAARPLDLAAALADLERVPRPAATLPVLLAALGADLLPRLAGDPPDADRAHLVALLVADLAGSYTASGLRAWFDRPRIALAGQSPAQVLTRPEFDIARDTPRLRELTGFMVAPAAS